MAKIFAMTDPAPTTHHDPVAELNRLADTSPPAVAATLRRAARGQPPRRRGVAVSAALFATVARGAYVVVEEHFAGASRRVYAAAVDHVTPTQIAIGSSRFRRSDGKQLGALTRYARPETADERLDRKARTAAAASIGRALHGHGSLDHIPTAQLVAIAAACEVTP